MAKTKWSEIKAALMHLAINRSSWYSNEFPFNCLYVHSGRDVSCDCIGLIKSLINNPNQAFSYAEGYVQPGLVIPDWTENQLINACPDKSSDFRNIQEGEILMTCIDGRGEEYGHGAWYVGEFVDPNYGSIQNVIECSSYNAGYAYYNGIFTSYVDENGHKWTSKGGQDMGTNWEYHGHLYDYVEFSDTPAPAPEPEPEPTPTSDKPEYRVYDDVKKAWLPIVRGDSDYAGIFGHDVDCIAIKDAEYCVHNWGGDASEHYEFSGWLETVKGYDITDVDKGFAGDYHPIDGLAIKSKKELMYQVHYRKLNKWEVPVSSKDFDLNDPENGFAGTIGEPIDGIRIWQK